MSKTIIVTKSKEDAHLFVDTLESAGNRVMCFPMITTEALPFDVPDISKYLALLFTSGNAARFFFERFIRHEPVIAKKQVLSIPCYALGERTSEALTKYGAMNIINTGSKNSEEFARYMKMNFPSQSRGRYENRFLFIRGSLSRTFLPQSLRAAGWICDEVCVYQVNAIEKKREALVELMKTPGQKIVAFFSPSSVENFYKQVGEVENVAFCAIGETTASSVSHFFRQPPCMIASKPSMQIFAQELALYATGIPHS